MFRRIALIATLAALSVGTLTGCGGPNTKTADGLREALETAGLCGNTRTPPTEGNGLFSSSSPLKDKLTTSFQCTDTYISVAGFATANDREESARRLQEINLSGYSYAGTGENLWLVLMNPQYEGSVGELCSDGIRGLYQG